MGRRILIAGGTVTDETCSETTDILVEDNRIVERSPGLSASPGTEIIDCSGKYLIPGLVDVHVHFDLESNGFRTADDFVSGTRSAAAGGVTTVVDFIDQDPGRPIRAIVEKAVKDRESVAAVDWSYHLVITAWSNEVRSEFRDLRSAGLSGSVKVFTAYRSRGLMSDDDQLYGILEASGSDEFITMVHAENDALISLFESRELKQEAGISGLARSRPPIAEEEAVSRVLLFAEYARGRIHIAHMSTPGSVSRLTDARSRGVWASGEVTPHHLFLSEDYLNRPDGALYTCCPPLRSDDIRGMLWNELRNGHIHIVSTDSCGFSPYAKQSAVDVRNIPMGLPGVETLFPLMYTRGVESEGMSLSRLTQILSANPARLLGVFPKKGVLRIGSDADILVFDPHERQRLTAKYLESKVGWSPYEGFLLAKPPESVYLKGQLIAQNGSFTGNRCHGCVLDRGDPVLPN